MTTKGFVFVILLISIAASVSALGGLADVGSQVAEAGGKMAEAGGKLGPSTCDVDDSDWKECPDAIDVLLETMRNALDSQPKPLMINTPQQFCEYIQIHNLHTLHRSGKCGSRKCTDGKKECFDQKLACGVKNMKIDCAFHTIDAIKKWITDQGFPLPPALSSVIKRGADDEKSDDKATQQSSSGRYFLHAECKKQCEINMLLKLDWNSDECPKVEQAGYSTGGFANLHIYWTGDTAAASFLEWLTTTDFIRAVFGILAQFALLFIMPGILRDNKTTEALTTLNCGD